jgi:aminoglycoside phosphotransferase (APT) family kinase protein
MRQLVDVLVDIHDIDSGEAAGVRPFTVYAQSSYALPKWATKPAVWERAIEIFHGPILDDDRAFIHRDFHPGNVLWHRRTVPGLVDWEAASVGPQSMDVAHRGRINLLYDGLDAADIFTRIWEQRTGRTFHRWADIATIIGLDSERRQPSPQRKRHDIETMLQQAVNEIDGP